MSNDQLNFNSNDSSNLLASSVNKVEFNQTMKRIIQENNLNLTKKNHIKILLSELYSTYHSWGDLAKTKNFLYLGLMKEIESNFPKTNLIEEDPEEKPKEVNKKFDDLIDLVEPKELKPEHDEKLIELSKELELKRKEEILFLSSQQSKINDIRNSASEGEDDRYERESLVNNYIKGEIKTNIAMSNNNFKLLLWIMKTKKAKLEKNPYDIVYDVNMDLMTKGKDDNIQLWKTDTNEKAQVEKEWEELANKFSQFL